MFHRPLSGCYHQQTSTIRYTSRCLRDSEFSFEYDQKTFGPHRIVHFPSESDSETMRKKGGVVQLYP